ncbi:hypothetical protein HIM_02620 [Hirsutella minnesotensis 3608]|nr:hypothetical protein HIM_02620 [Hirsutella minnesotensis 3608]
MAEVEEAQFNSLAERIAALNRQKNFNTPEPARKRPPPPPVPKARAETAPPPSANPVAPPRPARSNPPPLPRRDTQSSVASSQDASNGSVRPPPPPLPSRTPSSRPTPPGLPTRTSTQNSLVTLRRSSTTSDLSQPPSTTSGRPLSSKASNGSNHSTYQRKLPPVLSDPADLPPLPPPRRALEAVTPEARGGRTVPPSSPPRTSDASPPSRPTIPPRVPSRSAKSTATPQPSETEPTEASKAPRKLPLGLIRGFGSGQPTSQRLSVPTRPTASSPCNGGTPPPIPLASRPSLAQIEAASARTVTETPTLLDCWVCRDWSGPDAVAAQYPRQSLPRNDPTGHLARGLCDPFPSYTDKARAIFTWFHHNIFYDTEAFFGNNVQWQSVEDTIFSGRAVCQGYAETYKAIANRAGLDCVVVCGHGKGFGHTPLKRGERPPPAKPDGHAWNAVRVDGGDWKLIDACWGAGHICGNNNLYKQEFTPAQFTMSNDKFGLRHFPENPNHQFRNDGRTISWEEYFRGPIDGEPPTFYTNGYQEGIAEDSVEPKERDIAVYSGQIVRFQFSKVCEHWTSEKDGLGKPPLLLLSIHGVDGRKDEMIPIETNGYWHWVDVNARDLGAPGQSVEVAQLTTMNDRDARGVSASEFLSKRGKVGMSWAYVMKWELV